MPADLQSMFSVREVPWHGMGEILADYPGREEAMRLAGHTFKIGERQVFVGQPHSDTGIQMPTGKPEDGWKALINEDTGSLLHIAKTSYVPIQWPTMWDVADAIVGRDDVRYETGGLIKSGLIGWVLFWLDEPVTVSGDSSPIYPYGMVSQALDGSGGLNASSFSIRVVCWNTWSAAVRSAKESGTFYTFRHVGNPVERVAEAREVLHGIRQRHSAFIELAEDLAGMPVTDEGVKVFLERFIPQPEKVTDRVIRNLEERRGAVQSILDGVTCEGVRNTAYGLVQAAGEFLDHVRPYKSGDTYFARTVLKSEPLKASAVSLARDIAKEYAPVA